MTRRKGKIISGVTFLVIALGIAVVFGIWNKPHQNVEDAKAIAVTAEELYRSFVKDSVKAGQLYSNKVLQVSGEVSRVSENQQAQQVVFLRTGVPEAFINCTVEGKKINAKPGEQIRIKGICSGYIAGDADMGLPGDVFLVRSYPF